jgi:hypothetical protein
MKQYLIKEPKSPKDVLKILYYPKNKKVYNNYWSCKSQTPTLDEYKNIIVEKNKFRSLDSVINIAKTYFPNMNVLKFIKYIHNSKQFYFIGCKRIGKLTIGHEFDYECKELFAGDTKFAKELYKQKLNEEI